MVYPLCVPPNLPQIVPPGQRKLKRNSSFYFILRTKRPENGIFCVDFKVVSYLETACVPPVNLRCTPRGMHTPGWELLVNIIVIDVKLLIDNLYLGIEAIFWSRYKFWVKCPHFSRWIQGADYVTGMSHLVVDKEITTNICLTYVLAVR
jgi:hypothetical protein